MPRRTTTPPHPGITLRQRRRTLGLTAADVAEAAGVSLQMLEHVELGVRHPGVDWLGHVERVISNLTHERQEEQR